MEPSASKDPFDQLLNAGSSPELWVFVGGPVLVLLLIIAAYAALVVIRNRRERDALRLEVESDTGTGDAAPDDKAGAYSTPTHEPEDYDAPKAYPVPSDFAVDGTEPDGEASSPKTSTKLGVSREGAREAGAPAAPAAKIAPMPAPEPGAPAAKIALVPAAAPVARVSPTSPQDVEEIRHIDKGSWLVRLRSGLAKTRDALRGSLEKAFTGRTRLDSDVLERVHEALFRADVGVQTADKLVDHLRQTIGKDNAADWQSVSRVLKDEAEKILTSPSAVPLNIPAAGPWVILVVGVNGVGKTTSIGKLGAHFMAQDKAVLFGAGDTFRAAAIEQLGVWGDRLGIAVVKHQQGSDPAAVAYDSVKAAIARRSDVLLIDTAGRLHAKTELMAELGKINRVIGKDLPGAPHEIWLVIDATTGQNAVQQVKAFSEVAKVTGLVVTKLDGTAKGGVVLGIVDQFKLPVRYVGVGEKAADLRAFDPAEYADSLF